MRNIDCFIALLHARIYCCEGEQKGLLHDIPTQDELSAVDDKLVADSDSRFYVDSIKNIFSQSIVHTKTRLRLLKQLSPIAATILRSLKRYPAPLFEGVEVPGLEKAKGYITKGKYYNGWYDWFFGDRSSADQVILEYPTFNLRFPLLGVTDAPARQALHEAYNDIETHGHDPIVIMVFKYLVVPAAAKGSTMKIIWSCRKCSWVSSHRRFTGWTKYKKYDTPELKSDYELNRQGILRICSEI